MLVVLVVRPSGSDQQAPLALALRPRPSQADGPPVSLLTPGDLRIALYGKSTWELKGSGWDRAKAMSLFGPNSSHVYHDARVRLLSGGRLGLTLHVSVSGRTGVLLLSAVSLRASHARRFCGARAAQGGG